MARLKQLQRSMNYSMIAGICGGFAEYFGWRPNILRLILIGIIAASAGVTLLGVLPIYLVLWLLLPRATPDSYR